ncbi:MAG TPA: MipA/OmpV family protein [Alphaproteobacteria bacterium]|nr:MipA/OmpV family protein [Alphaproteobacteria bacterium]
MKLVLVLFRNFRAAAILAATGAAVAATQPAFAQSLDQEQVEEGSLAPSPVKKDWDVTLGIGAGVVPRYPGAGAYRATPLPMVSVRYRDLLFLGPAGLGANVIDWNGLRIGPVFGFEGGRDQSDDPHLSGLGSIAPSITGGGFLSYRYRHVQVTGTVRQAMTHSENGLLGRVSFDYLGTLVPKKLFVAMGPALDFDDGAYSRTWFGVTAAQSAASGLRADSPTGGLKDVGFHVRLTYRYTEHIVLLPLFNVTQFTTDAAASPIVQRDTQLTVGAGIAYRF